MFGMWVFLKTADKSAPSGVTLATWQMGKERRMVEVGGGREEENVTINRFSLETRLSVPKFNIVQRQPWYAEG